MRRVIDVKRTDVGFRVLMIEWTDGYYHCLDVCQYPNGVAYCGFIVLGSPSWSDQGIQQQTFTLFLDVWSDD